MGFLTQEERQKLRKDESGNRLAPTGSFSDEDWYTCQNSWPDNCFVQCGDFSVPSRNAFFEAFPRTPDTFLRGEGRTIAEAEASCWKKYQRILACKADHENPENFDRRNYKNGLGFCKTCGLSQMVFEPSEVCCKCGKNTYHSSDKEGNWWCEDCCKDMPKELKWDWQLEDEESLKNITDEELTEGLTAIFDNLLGKKAK